MAISHQAQRVSIKQMYSNPTGKGSSYVASRYSIRSGMNASFIKNLNHNRRAFLAVPYVADDGTTYIWVKVPSRNYQTNHIRYDAVFEIPPGDLPLALRPCKFFVNSPSFVFTYAYVFNQEDLLIDFLKNRLPTQCLTQAPVIRNPVESRGYELILYQAISYLILGKCLNPNYINKYKQKFDATKRIEMSVKIADVNRLIQIYNYAKYNNTKNHRKPISVAESNARKHEVASYKIESKKQTPDSPKKIFARKPQSKITARKARKGISF